MHENVPTAVCHKIRRITGISQGAFPFTYLGCPIFYGRRRIAHYEDLIKRVTKRVIGW